MSAPDLETTYRVHGDRHWRIFAKIGGPGWLTMVNEWAVRFEPDVGEPIGFVVHRMWVGLPSHDRAPNKRTPEALKAQMGCPWFTYEGPEIGHFVWAHERDAAAAKAWGTTSAAPEQPSLFSDAAMRGRR